MKPVPVECRDMVTGGEFWYGCSQQLAWWLEPWSATLGAICVAFLILHIVQARDLVSNRSTVASVTGIMANRLLGYIWPIFPSCCPCLVNPLTVSFPT